MVEKKAKSKSWTSACHQMRIKLTFQLCLTSQRQYVQHLNMCLRMGELWDEPGISPAPMVTLPFHPVAPAVVKGDSQPACVSLLNSMEHWVYKQLCSITGIVASQLATL